MATVILRNRHSLERLDLIQLIEKIRNGKLIQVDKLASFQQGNPLADLSIEELTTAYQDNLISDEPLANVLQKAGRVMNLDNCRLAVHEGICFANEFGQPQGQQKRKPDSLAPGSEDDDETEYGQSKKRLKMEQNSSIQSCSCDDNNYGDTQLHRAVQNRNIINLRCIIDQNDSDVNIQNESGDTPLHLAVWEGDIEIVKCINKAVIDVNTQNIDGNTPLHRAVYESMIEIVKNLTEHFSSNVNLLNIFGFTPLHIAVLNKNVIIARYIINSATCDVNLPDSRSNTPLHLAVGKNAIDIVRCIIKTGKCHVNKKNLAGYSSFSTTDGLQTLHKIAKWQNMELFHVLIQYNVDVLTNHVDNQLQLVEFILSENDFQSLWLCIKNDLFINSLTTSGENIVHLLPKFYIDYLPIDVSFLIDYGLDFDLINSCGYSPLMVASLLNNSAVIHFLAALPCDVNRQNHKGHTALHLCVIGFTLIKEKLNMMKVNEVVKELCARKYYPRYLACIDTLIKLRADVNMQDINGKTVLMFACMKNDRKLLKALLICGADVNIVDNHGRSALQYTDVTNNVCDLACFNLLLSHGCKQSFNQPCLNDNTLIQNLLQFPPLWQIAHIVNFIKLLVFKNVNLQLLTSYDGEVSYGQLSLEEFSSIYRHELRQLLYLSGGSISQIIQILHFDVEENYEASLPETVREKPREKLYLFANNLSLNEICKRVIRQNTGLAITDRISELVDNIRLQNFLLFKDNDSERFLLPLQLGNSIDENDDDYNSYDVYKESDDYENDYSMYDKDCKYLNEVHAGLEYGDSDSPNCSKDFKTTKVFEK